MPNLLERWSKASEEIKIYDKQLQEIIPSETFQKILSGTARPLTNPKLQLFKLQKTSTKRRANVQSRTAKK